jgi:hypothetical protein
MNYTFSDEEYLQRLKQQTIIGQEFMEAAFADWFEDTDKFRSPFPEKMRDKLSELTFRLFMEWTFQRQEHDGPITAEELGEKFGEIIQMVSISLAQSDEERMTIYYPDLPRVGDAVTFHGESESDTREGEVVNRYLVDTDGHKELRLLGRYNDTGEVWETGFDLMD